MMGEQLRILVTITLVLVTISGVRPTLAAPSTRNLAVEIKPSDAPAGPTGCLTGLSPIIVNHNVNLCGVGHDRSVLPAAPAGFSWSYVANLSDEFNGATLDATKWQPTTHLWVPAECFAGNVSVDNGFLKLSSTVAPNEQIDSWTVPWVQSGCLTSTNMNYGYGYYEARILTNDLPLESAFWFRSPYEEADVVEAGAAPILGGKPASYYFATTHYFPNGTPSVQNPATRYECSTSTPVTRWHVYGVWIKNSSSILFYVDGKLVAAETPPGPFDQPEALWFSELQPPAQCCRLVTFDELENFNLNTVYVDWVRSYSLVARVSQSGG